VLYEDISCYGIHVRGQCHSRGIMKKYIFNKKAVTFLATLIILNNSVVVGGDAHPLDLTDSGHNDWFNIELSMQDGEAHFQWNSEYPSTTVEISGNSIATLTSQEEGSIEAAANSADSVLEFNIQAERTIEESHQPGSEPRSPLTVQFITSLRVDNPNSSTNWFHETPASASSAAAKTYLRYQTFIPKKYLEAPPIECTPDGSQAFLFEGDNRGFDPTSNDYKTRFQVTVDWLNQGNLSLSRSVGATRRYKDDGKGSPILSTLETKTASSNGMVFTSYSNSSTLVHYKLDHAVTNPMCSGVFTDSIWYETDVWIARSGAYTITKKFRLAPNHELYIKDSDQSDWTTLMQESTYTMDCLNKAFSWSAFCNKSESFHETWR